MGRVKLNGDFEVKVALAGNPNVGKSTIFNSLTGMKRHTGNWAGKTVSCATASVVSERRTYSVADVPGTYSLLSHSYEEELARNYICFGGADITVVVLDATSLEHSLPLALQVLEVRHNVVVALNLCDEARRRGIEIDVSLLSRLLGVPVVPTVAKKRKTLDALLRLLDDAPVGEVKPPKLHLDYNERIVNAANMVERALLSSGVSCELSRWVALRLIEGDEELCREIERSLSVPVLSGEIFAATLRAREYLFEFNIDADKYRDETVSKIISESEKIAAAVVKYKREGARARDIRLDKILTGKYTAIPIMLLLLFLVMWITVSLANYPSAALAALFSYLGGLLSKFLDFLHTPPIISAAIVDGIFMTVGRVVAVMLPPMAIFFPLFALLEDSGYLPRVAYNLDRPFACAGACGKQALTMCMGLGCCAVGISGARIISSRRERNLAILTNSLMPCNGKFPMLISLVSIIFITVWGKNSDFLTSLAIVFMISLAVGATFLSTYVLSKTLLRGEPSSFTLELVPYRRPEYFKVIYRSLTTKALAVLLRALAVAAPMGLIIFILANIYVGGESLVTHAAAFLDPVGRVLGLDGSILLAFLLGLPANEIVLPLLCMIYASGGSVGAELDVLSMASLFSENGWNLIRAVCTAIFALFHFPCSTSIITVYKETKSIKYTLVATLLPLCVGVLLCGAVNLVYTIFFV